MRDHRFRLDQDRGRDFDRHSRSPRRLISCRLIRIMITQLGADLELIRLACA